MNLDSGAAIHALPVSVFPAVSDTSNNYKTASGEKIPDYGQVKLKLEDENGIHRNLTGNVTKVHKALASAGVMAKAGQQIWLDKTGGAVIPGNSKIAKDLDRAYRRALRKHKHEVKGIMPVYLENGVYNCYFKVKSIEEVAAVSKPPPTPKE